MVKYRKAFRSSIRDALSAEKVRERERKKLWNSSPDRIRKGNQSIKKLNKSDEEREFREKKKSNDDVPFASLSIAPRSPASLSRSRRESYPRWKSDAACFLFVFSFPKEVFRNNQKVTKKREGKRWMAENEQLKKTGRFRVRFGMKKYARKTSSESSSFMTYNAPAQGSVASNNNMNMYNIINN